LTVLLAALQAGAEKFRLRSKWRETGYSPIGIAFARTPATPKRFPFPTWRISAERMEEGTFIEMLTPRETPQAMSLSLWANIRDGKGDMSVSLPFDPIQRSAEAEGLVMRGDKRLYHKFRGAPYYGGIATADAVGCSFRCAYCWNYGRNENPARSGHDYSAEEVADRLLAISRSRNFHRFRITGSEPILGEASFGHLIKVIEIVLQASPYSRFILETNGLMLGYREDLAERLTSRNIMVRIAVKGVDPASFEKITGARREFFTYPVLAIQNLERRGLTVWPALMQDLFSEAETDKLKRTLRENGVQSELELECLEAYRFVLENLRTRGVPLKRDRGGDSIT
jgi:uncharacterized Fe-S cluster-containing radical SAM superfamily protein